MKIEFQNNILNVQDLRTLTFPICSQKLALWTILIYFAVAPIVICSYAGFAFVFSKNILPTISHQLHANFFFFGLSACTSCYVFSAVHADNWLLAHGQGIFCNLKIRCSMKHLFSCFGIADLSFSCGIIFANPVSLQILAMLA